MLILRTGLGRWELRWSAAGLSCFRPSDAAPDPAQAPPWARAAAALLQKHLDGAPQDLSRLPLDLSACTDFQRRVFEALRRTRPGQLLSYGEAALLAGSPGAARAVGRAVARNPLLVLVPCHRVVAADGPGGWSAFGSPELKAALLDLERLP